MKPIQYIRQAFYKGLVSYLVAPASVTPAPEAPVRQRREDLQSLMQPGDVILVAGKTRFASLVCRLTQSTWSHVAIYVGPGHHADPTYCVVEADVEAGVRFITLAELIDHDIQVVRASRLPQSSRQELIDYLLARVGLPYDLNHVIELARLVLFAPSPLGRWLSPKTMRRADPTRAICSTLVAHALFTAGVSVGAAPIVAARLQHAAREHESDLRAALDYLVPGDFERLPEFVPVFNSRKA